MIQYVANIIFIKDLNITFCEGNEGVATKNWSEGIQPISHRYRVLRDLCQLIWSINTF